MKNLSKSLICSIAVLLLMILGCQKEDVEIPTIDSTPSISYRVVSLDELPQLKPVLENIKKFKNENSELARGETYLGIDSVLVDNVIQITIDGVSSYSFGIDTDFYNTKYVDNLHLHEKGSDYIGYVMRYTTPAGWEADTTNYTPEGYLFIDRDDFDGYITKYALDGQIIWTSDPNLLGRGNWDTQCSWISIKLCSNNGFGGQGTTHVAGPGCTGYPKGQYTYTYDYVCETVDYFDSNDSDGTVTGGGGGAPECTYLLGSPVSGTTVSSGYSDECVENPYTPQPILLFEEWEEIVDCINGFDPIGSTDETTLAPIMINWLDTEASPETITAINNFLNDNGCSEESQTIGMGIMEILMETANMNFEEAFYEFIINNLSTEEIDEFNWYEDENSTLAKDIRKLMDCFTNIDNISSVSTYEFGIYVEQPMPNTTATHNGSDPGHTFISMSINDPIIPSNNITQTFGYYPAGDVNPLIGDNTSYGEIRDNSGHVYNVSATISLNNAQFYSIVYALEAFGDSIPQYNLNTYNCTDFALNYSDMANMALPDTYGEWRSGALLGNILLGGGSNPGNLGQDIRNMNNSSITVTIIDSGANAPIGEGECD